MALAFNAAPFDTNDDGKSSTYQSESNHNKTIKRSFNVPNKIDTMKQHLVLQSIDAEDSGLVDFNPPARPTSIGAVRTEERSNEDTVAPQESTYMINKGISVKLADSNYKEQYASPYAGRQTFDTDRAFVSKLEYMIHMLEEQREIKTGSATEEVILYSFLGVFIIFVLDSFARAGRYTR